MDDPKPKPTASRRRADGGVVSDAEAQAEAESDYQDRMAMQKRIKDGMVSETFQLKAPIKPAPIKPKATPTPEQKAPGY